MKKVAKIIMGVLFVLAPTMAVAKTHHCGDLKAQVDGMSFNGYETWNMVVKGEDTFAKGSPAIWVADNSEFYKLSANVDYILKFDKSNRTWYLNNTACGN